MYKSYFETVSTGHVVLVYFCSEVATLAKSGTQGATFLHMRFGNLKFYTETWFNVGIAPTSTAISASFLVRKRRKLKLQLVQRIIFILFKPLIGIS